MKKINLKKIWLLLSFLAISFNSFSQTENIKIAFDNLQVSFKEYELKLPINTEFRDSYMVEPATVVYNYPNLCISYKVKLAPGYIKTGTKDNNIGTYTYTFDLFKSNIDFKDRDYRPYLIITSPYGLSKDYDGKKDIVEYFIIDGSRLTLKQLTNQFLTLQSIIKKENYTGSLGETSSKNRTGKSNKTDSKTPSQKKSNSGKYGQ